MKEIKLTNGMVAKVDDEDLYFLNLHKWHVIKQPNNRFYAATTTIDDFGNKTQLRMHRMIIGEACRGFEIDHINHNGLDNRKKNIRICTASENQMNRRKRIGSRSKYKGIYWNKVKDRWLASIKLNGKRMHIGLYDSEIDAAKAYNEKAKQLFGQFANLNTFE